MRRSRVKHSRFIPPVCPGCMCIQSVKPPRRIPWYQVSHEIVKEDNDRVRVRVEYVVLSGSEGDHDYPVLRSYGEQGFFLFAGTPGRSRLAVYVYVRGEHRNRYWRKVESMNRVLEGDFDVTALNLHYPQEGFSAGSGGDVTNQYPAKVEEYERTNAAALDSLYHHRGIVMLTTGMPKADNISQGDLPSFVHRYANSKRQGYPLGRSNRSS